MKIKRKIHFNFLVQPVTPSPTLTVQDLLLSLGRLDLGNVKGRVEQTELAATIEALVLAQSIGVDAERGGLLGNDQVLLLLARPILAAVVRATAI